MSRYYQRPENALKKANEFIEVGKPTRALDTLYDVIKGKKHRAFSEKVIEPIMLKYLELCVELKKPHTAKEGLYQYRLMCQSVNVGLLEKVIRSFIRMAEERTELARDNLKNKVLLEQSTQAVVEVDDLDNVSMAEMTLLNVITEEQAQERSDRAALIPWVKFLWESYTQCLDLLRNNARLENLYHDIAQMAFKFCLSYNRKTEFRKLCERLRKHFDDIVNRASTQMNSIDFSSPETQQFNMETRLAQLDSAITMELWQEAYKAIEDIHLLMNQSKKSQTRMMAYYYQKLSLVFWKAGNLLFHAATMLKYYMLCKDMKKNVSQEELQKNASQVVLATLAISFPVSHPEFERFVETDKGMLEKAQKLATLLFLPQPPTRASLIRDLSRHNVINNAIPQLQGLHDLLETEFNPLGLCSEVDGIIQEIMGNEENEYLQQYIEPLHDVASVRLIKQVSQVYQSIDYNHLLEMTVFSNQARLEQILVDAVRYNDMQITIDHRSNCIRFGASLAEASREDLPEGPHLQAMPSEAVRLQLVNVFNCLEDTIDMINPSHVIDEEDNLRTKIVTHYMMTEKQSHMQLLQRQKIIAERREELERSAVDKENEEKWRTEQMIKQQAILQAKLLETQREERAKKRLEIEKQELQQKRLEERMKQIASTQWGNRVPLKIEDYEKMDIETIMLRQQEQLAKEAKEHQARMRAQEKRLDHLERAKRVEEVPVIEKYLKEKKEQEKEEWEVHETERITHLIEERKLAVANRDRMKKMIPDKEQFLSKLLEARRGEFVAKLADFERRLSEERARRLEERKQQRKEDRRRKWIDEKEEEERLRMEEIRRVEEEKEREEREKRQREIDEQNRITEEKQRLKDIEIEERLKADRQSGERGPEATSGTGGGGGGNAPGPWRRGQTRPTAPSGDSERVSSAGTGDSKPAPASGGSAWVPPHVARKKATEGPMDAGQEEPEFRRNVEITREIRRDDAPRQERDLTRDGPRVDRERDGPRGDRDGLRGDRDRDGARGPPRDRDGPRADRGGREGPRPGDRDREAPRGDRDSGAGWRTAGSERPDNRSYGSDRPERGDSRNFGGSDRRDNRNFERSDRDREGGGRGGFSDNRRENRNFGTEGGESRGFDRENRNFRGEGGRGRDFGGENRNFRGERREGEGGRTGEFGGPRRAERTEGTRDGDNRNFRNPEATADNWRK